MNHRFCLICSRTEQCDWVGPYFHYIVRPNILLVSQNFWKLQFNNYGEILDRIESSLVRAMNGNNSTGEIFISVILLPLKRYEFHHIKVEGEIRPKLGYKENRVYKGTVTESFVRKILSEIHKATG